MGRSWGSGSCAGSHPSEIDRSEKETDAGQLYDVCVKKIGHRGKDGTRQSTTDSNLATDTVPTHSDQHESDDLRNVSRVAFWRHIHGDWGIHDHEASDNAERIVTSAKSDIRLGACQGCNMPHIRAGRTRLSHR